MHNMHLTMSLCKSILLYSIHVCKTSKKNVVSKYSIKLISLFNNTTTPANMSKSCFVNNYVLFIWKIPINLRVRAGIWAFLLYQYTNQIKKKLCAMETFLHAGLSRIYSKSYQRNFIRELDFRRIYKIIH